MVTKIFDLGKRLWPMPMKPMYIVVFSPNLFYPQKPEIVYNTVIGFNTKGATLKKLKSDHPHNITGKDFGKWRVIEEIDDPRAGRHFEAMCMGCGEIHSVLGVNLRKGRSVQCVKCARASQSLEMSMLGKRYGKWTVLKVAGKQFNSYSYLCRCDCGFEKVLHGPHLRYGNTTQCTSCSNRIKASKNKTHGMARNLQYKVWTSLVSRCTNPNDKAWKYYGGRGIKVCDSWRRFENFLKDMGNRPPGMTIDRIDNDGDYCKENCRWVSHQENCQNRRKIYERQKNPES